MIAQGFAVDQPFDAGDPFAARFLFRMFPQRDLPVSSCRFLSFRAVQLLILLRP